MISKYHWYAIDDAPWFPQPGKPLRMLRSLWYWTPNEDIWLTRNKYHITFPPPPYPVLGVDGQVGNLVEGSIFFKVVSHHNVSIGNLKGTRSIHITLTTQVRRVKAHRNYNSIFPMKNTCVHVVQVVCIVPTNYVEKPQN